MPVLLNKPIDTVSLDQAKVANINIETNEEQGRQWVDLYIVYGKVINELFTQHAHPKSGVEAEQLHFETGLHPEQANVALGVCNTCSKQFIGAVSGDCDVDGCAGQIEPYDGMIRLIGPVYELIKNHMYNFLLNEQVIDVETGEMKKLLDATEIE